VGGMPSPSVRLCIHRLVMTSYVPKWVTDRREVKINCPGISKGTTFSAVILALSCRIGYIGRPRFATPFQRRMTNGQEIAAPDDC